MTQTKQYDIAIIGGGLVGASLAAALAKTRYKIAVIESFAFDDAAQPSYDERTIALTYSARHIFSQIGVWTPKVKEAACAISQIHISNRGHFGITHLSHQDAGTKALGYVVPTRVLGQALLKQILSQENIDYYCPFSANTVTVKTDFTNVELISSKDNSSLNCQAKLAIIADGGRSPLLASLGFTKKHHPYQQSALLSIVSTDKPHQNTAYERFLSQGPLALLPMTEQRYAVVWTLSPEELPKVQHFPNDQFLAYLQSTFGMRAGQFSQPSPRKTYPLSKDHLDSPFKHRILVLGNAAHTVHPVAGQGFNLGLRDVAALAQNLHDASKNQDIGNVEFLTNYYKDRGPDAERVEQFTDGLLRVFSHPSPFVQLGRNLGLGLVENLPFIKRALLRRSMGLGKNQPRLARGLRLD